MAEEMDRPDPYRMAEEMGYSLLADWRAYFKVKREADLQQRAARRAEDGVQRPRGR